MSAINRISRIKKLEGVRRDNTAGRFFMVWGQDEADLLSIVGDALLRLIIAPESPMLAMVWPHKQQPLPSSRWVTHLNISDVEVQAVCNCCLTAGGEAVETTDTGRRQAYELTNDELWDCIVSGSREASDQLIRAVLH